MKVVTLTKHRGLEKPDDEQLHVLPMYVLDESDEFGDREAQNNKLKNGSIEMLSKYDFSAINNYFYSKYDVYNFVFCSILDFHLRLESDQCHWSLVVEKNVKANSPKRPIKKLSPKRNK